jgi:hypothetical protein
MRFDYDTGLRCWALRRYADVHAALKDPQRFAFMPTQGFDESGHTRTLRAAMDTFLQMGCANWRHRLEDLPALPAPEELVSQWIEPWCHAAALQLVTLPSANGERLRMLARKAYESGAFVDAPAADAESQELAAHLPSVLGPLTVQAFVAISQTLAAFLANAAAALLEQRLVYPHTPRALEETLRCCGPSQAVFRYLTESTGGLSKGTRIALLLAEANRDPDRFPDPDRLCFERNASGHLALGYGLHACIGAALIRTAAPVALQHITKLIANVEHFSTEWPAEQRIIRSPSAIRIRELAGREMRYQE